MTVPGQVRAPVCPRCGRPPLPLAPGVRPYFCASGDCAVVCWNPDADPANFEATATVINLPDEREGAP